MKYIAWSPLSWLGWLFSVSLIGPGSLCVAEPSATGPVAAATPGGAFEAAAARPGADSTWPMLVGAQYTFILQNQSALRSPCDRGPVHFWSVRLHLEY